MALLFLATTAGLIGAMFCYTQVSNTAVVRVTGLGTVNANNLAVALCLGFAFLAMGCGAIHGARTLMTDVDLVQERHLMASDDESRAEAVSEFKQGVEDSGFTKYPLIRRSLLLAMGILPLPAVWIRPGCLPSVPTPLHRSQGTKPRGRARRKSRSRCSRRTSRPIRWA